jgi:2-keto-4-pentenoate hydratase
MNQQTKRGELAALIRAAYAGTPIAPIRPRLAELDVDGAYAIQQENTAHWEAEGRRLIGSKIGLTSRAVQKQLGVNRPDFGVLFADMIVAEDEPVAAGRVLQPKIEAEVAFLLDRDVDVEAPTVADVLRAVAYAMPALEIVGSRITNWDIGIVDTVADNASSGLFVLGGPVRRLDGLDLRALQMQMTRREEVVSKGTVPHALATLSTRWRGWPANWLAVSVDCAPATSCSPERSAPWCRSIRATPSRRTSRVSARCPPNSRSEKVAEADKVEKEPHMKLVRFGNPGAEKPGLIDEQGGLRDLSSVIADITPDNLSRSMLEKLAAISPPMLPSVAGARLGVPLAGVGKFVAIGSIMPITPRRRISRCRPSRSSFRKRSPRSAVRTIPSSCRGAPGNRIGKSSSAS